MSKQYAYDAFISYRHLPLDEAIAEKIQLRLEQYRPPRHKGIQPGARINRIFRDKTELPTSGDLSQSLTDALLSSRYLIVVLSEETKNSKWCMEEIRAFKEAHGGSIDHILPVLVSGEPQTAIPDLLRYEYRDSVDGGRVLVEVEPLCCDVRSGSLRASLKRLKTEFLRLAAPILGCKFDDLYQRHLRRSNRLKLTALTAMAAVLGVIAFFAVNTYLAEQRYERNLVDTYTRQGAEQLTQDNAQKALMYYAGALRLDPSDQAAKTGALLLLQKNAWLRFSGQREGRLIDGRPFFGSSPYASAMNEAGSRIVVSRLSGAYMADETGAKIQDFTQYGEFLQSAEDGSCWTFADSASIYFIFTEDGQVWQIPRPTKINPACNMDDLDVFADSPPAAMALSRSRAAVRWGGYLYLYHLNEDGSAELFQTFDLSYVFEEANQSYELDIWNETWIDDGGDLAVLYDGSHAAIFSVTSKTPSLDRLCANYEYGLNDVAFSPDGSRFALVYGNDAGIDGLDPGGYFAVYDQSGSAIEYESDTPLSGAAFEPDGSRMLVWGGSSIYIWDCEKGEPAAVPLQLSKITGAAWDEDGSILIDDGSGILSIYEPVAFTLAEPAPDAPQTTDKISTFAREVTLPGGLILAHSYDEITLSSADGALLATADFGEASDFVMVNRMYADPASYAGFFWYQAQSGLYRATIDEKNKTFSSASAIDTCGWPVVGVHACAGGAAVFTGNGYVLYYAHQDVSPRLTLKLSQSGVVQEAASDGSGLLTVILRSSDFADKDSYSHAIRYSMELWDLNMGVLLGSLENGSARLEQPCFAENGWLTYQKAGEPVARKLDIPDPDPETVGYLAGISCYHLSDNQFAETRIAQFPPEIAGNWNTVLSASPVLPQTDAAPPGETALLIEALSRTLREEGEEAWLSEYELLWQEMRAGSADYSTIRLLFQNYVQTARALDLDEQLRAGFDCFVHKTKELSPRSTQALSADLLITQYSLLSAAYDDLIIDYWDSSADRIGAQLDSSDDWLMDFLAMYENRLYARLLSGEGAHAFYSAVDSAYHDQLAVIITQTGLQPIFYMAVGKPDMAAESVNETLRQMSDIYRSDPEEFRLETENHLFMMGCILNMLSQRGVCSEEDLTAFMNGLSVNIGCRLAQVSLQNLENGLRLGDVVTAVNGVRISNSYHIDELMEKYPSARLTVLRDGAYFTTDVIENWLISGSFEME